MYRFVMSVHVKISEVLEMRRVAACSTDLTSQHMLTVAKQTNKTLLH